MSPYLDGANSESRETACGCIPAYNEHREKKDLYFLAVCLCGLDEYLNIAR